MIEVSEPDGIAGRPLHERVLLFLAERLGPALDVLDVTSHESWPVRDIIEHFGEGTPFASPAEVRAALYDLHDAEHVQSWGLDARPEPDGSRGFRPAVMKAESAVRVTCRGLVAARAIVPGCGRSLSRLTMTLRTRRAKPFLDLTLCTRNDERDLMLNASPTRVGMALILLVMAPSQNRPLVVKNCPDLLERLATHGAPRRPGPKADRLTSVDAIREALLALEKPLSVTRAYFGEDKRRDYYYLSGPLPEIRIEPGDPRHYGDWQSVKHALWRVLQEGTITGDEGMMAAMLLRPVKSSERPTQQEETASSAAKPRMKPATDSGQGSASQ